jgi:hypothetical protein
MQRLESAVVRAVDDRNTAHRPSPGIVVKSCLDKCDRAAFVLLHTPDGTAAFPNATPAQLDEALDQLDAG